MGKKSVKPGRESFKIKAEVEPKLTPIDIETRKLGSLDEGVSISLKYFRQETECFSDWRPDELRKFSGLIKKIKQISANSLRGYKPLCEPHKYSPAEARFSRPDLLSEDLSFFELKIDPSNAARVHGVFVGSVFFLVWLDRLHAVYPE